MFSEGASGSLAWREAQGACFGGGDLFSISRCWSLEFMSRKEMCWMSGLTSGLTSDLKSDLTSDLTSAEGSTEPRIWPRDGSAARRVVDVAAPSRARFARLRRAFRKVEGNGLVHAHRRVLVPANRME